MNILKSLLSYLLNPRSNPRFSQEVLSIEKTERLEAPQLRSAIRASYLNPPLVLGLSIVLILVVVILFGPLWTIHDPYITSRTVVPHYDAAQKTMVKPPFPPSTGHILGTDTFGNDLLSLLVHGARVTLVVAGYITFSRILLGSLLGMLAGWWSGKLPDRLIMALMGVVTSIPLLLSSMILIYAIGINRGMWVFLLALTLLGWTEITQQIRGLTMVIRRQAYIEGAVASGLKEIEIIVRHALPNLLPQLLVLSFLEMGAVLVLLAELGFLGIFIGGVSYFNLDPSFGGMPIRLQETPEWGALLARSFRYIRSYPWLVLGPALAFFISVLGLNALGDGFRRLFERAPISTSFLLRRRIVVILLGFLAIAVLIFQYTGPRLSYAKAASGFDGEAAVRISQEIREMSIGDVQENHPDPVTSYIKQQFRTYELQPVSLETVQFDYFWEVETPKLSSSQEPDLSIRSGIEAGIDFRYNEDFLVLETGNKADPGKVSAPLTLITFGIPDTSQFYSRPYPEDFFGEDYSGQILLLIEGNAPSTFPLIAARQGAAGVVWIAGVNRPRYTNPQWGDLIREADSFPIIPVFQLNAAASQQIMTQPSISEPVNRISGDMPRDQFWQTINTGLQVEMDLTGVEFSSTKVPVVIGFLPGFDEFLASETIVIWTKYDSTGTTDPAQHQGLAIVFELINQWKQQLVDPRRSILFIAWGGDDSSLATARSFLENRDLYGRLNIPTRRTGFPAMIIQLQPVFGSEPALWISPNSDSKLESLFTQSARQTGVRLQPAPADVALTTQGALTANIPSLALNWTSPIGDSANSLEAFGESLSMMLIQLIRQPNY